MEETDDNEKKSECDDNRKDGLLLELQLLLYPIYPKLLKE